MNGKTKLNLAVIGTGRIGRIHAENIAQRVSGAQLAAVADVNLDVAREVGGRLGVPKVAEDYHALLSDPDIDAIIICSSTDTHAQIIREGAAAKKHIFCEKPIAHDLHEIDTALQAVESAGVKLQVGFHRRFDPGFRKAYDLIQEGRLGSLRTVRITSRDPSPPPLDYIRHSGGIFMDMTIHDFDMARFLIGSEAEEVYAVGGVMVDPEIGKANDLDTVLVMMRFANSVIATIDNCRQAAYGYDQRVEVLGSGGMVQIENETPDRHIYSDPTGIHLALPQHFFLERYTIAFAKEMQAFVDAVLNDQPTRVTGLDGRMPVVMGIAALKSCRENRPVRLEEIA